jgi:predicted acylesterase/phospholipase RssA
MFSSLALGGGGVRGGLHVGALAALEKVRGSLTFPNGIYGCSIGSIVATAIAFNLNSSQIHDMFTTHFELNKIIPQIRLSSVSDLVSKKGLFQMDMLEKTILNAFDSQNIDLRGKLISETNQKLYIVASNMTTQNTTIFSENVPILDAIKCSSCLPLVFTPQILYNQVYLDGGVFVRCLSSVVPEDTLTISITFPPQKVFPSDIENLTIPGFIGRIYSGSQKAHVSKNTLHLHNDTINILQELTAEDKQLLYDQGYSQTLAFLTKRASQE